MRSFVIKLQRGRAPGGAELKARAIPEKSGGELQRGRAPGGAELRYGNLSHGRVVGASPGPRPGGRGIGAQAHAGSQVRVGLQRGRAPGGAEFTCQIACSSPTKQLQRGRAPGGAEFSVMSDGANWIITCFNGAAPRGARNFLGTGLL